MRKKRFTNERYAEIKTALENNKITSKELDNYIQMKALRYARYREENNYTDDDIEAIINGEKSVDDPKSE